MERRAEELEMEILERCLRRLEEGADLEACLREFPEAAALRPLLEAALWIQQGRQATLRPSVLRRMIREGQMRAAALRPSPRPAPRTLQWAGLLAAFLGLLLAALGVVGAAEASLPDTPLYPVKRAVEGLLAIAMPPADRALWLAERRWEEFERAAGQGRWLPALAEESLREAEIAARAEGGGSSPRAARLRALLARQEALLTHASQDAPLEIRPALVRARARWAELARSLQMLESESSSSPTPAEGFASPMPSTPTAEVLRERTRTPPGLEKKEKEKKKEETPPGLEKRETPPPQRTPPGQGQRPPTRTPPGPQGPGSSPGPSQDKGQDSKNVPPERR